MDILIQRIDKALSLTYDFYLHIREEHLELKISELPSNTIGEQAYCIIGARESYLNALEKGQWIGFSCSLTSTTDKSLILSKLLETQANIENYLQRNSLNEKDYSILFDLLEHEAQHHGQLIRFAYANKIGFPKSWNDRYTV